MKTRTYRCTSMTADAPSFPRMPAGSWLRGRKVRTMNQPALSIQLYAVNGQLTEISTKRTLARCPPWACATSKPSTSSAGPQSSPRRSPVTASQPRPATRLSSPMSWRRGDTVIPAPEKEDVFEAAQTLGLDILIDAFVSPDRWLDEEQVAATADRLNQAAERARIRLARGYHNHTQEFAASFGGRSAFEVFAEQLRDDVTLEVDLYWAATASRMCRLCWVVLGIVSRLCM